MCTVEIGITPQTTSGCTHLGSGRMSWADLERLVADAETSQVLLQTARQQGYRVTRGDLLNAWLKHHNARTVNVAGGADRLAASGP